MQGFSARKARLAPAAPVLLELSWETQALAGAPGGGSGRAWQEAKVHITLPPPWGVSRASRDAELYSFGQWQCS